MRTSLLALVLIFCAKISVAQTDFPYQISLEPLTVTDLPGLHSYAVAEHDGKWLLLGGRLDGIHARQPFNAFPVSQNNTEILVADPEEGQFWTTSVASLPVSLAEQMQSTNMQFFQDGETLVIVGGYGFSNSMDDHMTYPYLTTVDVPGLMEAVISGEAIGSYFKQIQDDAFAVTGGQLGKIGDDFYLVGGHRFDGRYNPMNHPTFVQTYTNQIRKFQVENSGATLAFSGYEEVTDPMHLHRRDYNLLPQIFPDGEFGYTMFSGVFQLNQDLPYLYPIDVREGGYEANTSFNQYLCNYHSANVALFDEASQSMHNLFFGGISQYYYDGDEMVQDDLVPFVKTISRVTRLADGTLEEVRLPVEMPGYLGASAEFILNPALELAASDIVKLDDLPSDGILLGYIFGGIDSEQLNPFQFNNDEVTSASANIFKVYLEPMAVNAAGEIALPGYHDFGVKVFPNPSNSQVFQLEVNAPESGLIEIIVYDTLGNLILNESMERFPEGKHRLEVEMETEQRGNFFVNTFLNGKYAASTNLIIE